MALGPLLRRQRESRGMTQEDLAEKAGGRCTARTIGNIERGDTRPHQHTLQGLMDALDLTDGERADLLAAWRGGSRRALPLVTTAGTAPRAPLPPLIGRAAELSQIARLIAGSGPPVLLLTGEPGIGKTRLLREAAAWGYAADLTVVEGGCRRHSRHDPYAPVSEALARYIDTQASGMLPTLLQGCGWIVRLLPELLERVRLPLPFGTLPPEQERRLMFGAARRFLANAARVERTLLILDDLQWAGRDALDLLAALLVGGGEPAVRVLAAYRTTDVRSGDPLSDFVADLARQDAVGPIPLGPLAPNEAEQLLATWLPDAMDLDRAERKRILDRAEGVPFFLISSARSLRLPGVPPGKASDLPWNLREVVRQRVVALPAPEQEVLGAAAIVGRVVPRALLNAVAAHPEAVVLDALATLCANRLLEEQGAHDYRFAHDVIREVVEAELSSGQRALLHRRAAEALEGGTGAPVVELLAFHYSRAGNDEMAARYLEEAGDHAHAQCAHAAAQAHYQDAADRFKHLGRSLDAARAQQKLGLALRLEGRRYDAALAALEAAARAFEVADDRESLTRLAWARMELDDLETAADAAKRAVRDQ